MFDDPVSPLRRRFPAGPPHAGDGLMRSAVPEVPFAVRFGVPAQAITAKHSRPPTRTRICQPTSVGGDGKAGHPPRTDDQQIDATD